MATTHLSSDDMLNLLDAVLLRAETMYQRWKAKRPGERFPLTPNFEGCMVRLKRQQLEWDAQLRQGQTPWHEERAESDLISVANFVFDVAEELGVKVTRPDFEKQLFRRGKA